MTGVVAWHFRRAGINSEKLFIVSACLSVTPCVRLYHGGSYWTDFREIWYRELLRKPVEKPQIWLKSDDNIGHFTWRPKHVFYYLVNETNLVHNLFLVYFVNFIYNLYKFPTSPGPSSGGTTVFLRHLVLVILKLVDSLKFPLYSSIKMLLYSGIHVNFFYLFICYTISRK